MSFELIGASAKKGTKCGHSKTLTYEIQHFSNDKYGTPYPPRDKCYITVSKTANSKSELTVLYLKKVLLPFLGVRDEVTFNYRIGVLCDDFKGHSSSECKSYITGHESRE